MADAYMLAIDLAKRSFQVCATDRAGSVLYNRAMSRAKLEVLLKEHPACIVAMEACATSHFWGRQAQAAGHEARLIPPIYVKPFVKRQKNDASDAAAIGEAARRPDMHYVAVDRLDPILISMRIDEGGHADRVDDPEPGIRSRENLLAKRAAIRRPHQFTPPQWWCSYLACQVANQHKQQYQRCLGDGMVVIMHSLI